MTIKSFEVFASVGLDESVGILRKITDGINEKLVKLGVNSDSVINVSYVHKPFEYGVSSSAVVFYRG